MKIALDNAYCCYTECIPVNRSRVGRYTSSKKEHKYFKSIAVGAIAQASVKKHCDFYHQFFVSLEVCRGREVFVSMGSPIDIYEHLATTDTWQPRFINRYVYANATYSPMNVNAKASALIHA